ncbi:response regulator [Pseudomonas aeruginosa]
MIKILLTEDEHEKKRLIVSELLKIKDLGYDSIDYASDVREAKRLLSRKKYDLVILDINLPARAGESAEKSGGLQLLLFLKVHHKAIQPSYIVGLTAYDEAASAAEEAFASPLRKLIRFSMTDMAWSHQLSSAVEHLIHINKPPYPCDGSTYHTDIAIFVALDGEELSSILALDAGWQRVEVMHDLTTYYSGAFSRGDKRLSVVLAAAPRMGMPPAAVISTKMINAFRPQYIAIAGICAGVRDKVKMGDVLVADPCFDWGSGKWVKSESGPAEFRPSLYQWRLDPQLAAAFKDFSQNAGVLQAIYDTWDQKKPEQIPRIYVDAMASGASVLQSQEHVAGIRSLHKNLIGIEMESYSVFTAAEYSSSPKPKCFSIKAVCDFGDDQKDDDFHDYAAFMSARVLFDFCLEKIDPINEELD